MVKYDSFANFAEVNKEKLFRKWDRRDKESVMCDFIYIVEVIELKNDILLGVRTYDEDYKDLMYPYTTYLKLSEIDLAFSPDDIEGDD